MPLRSAPRFASDRGMRGRRQRRRRIPVPTRQSARGQGLTEFALVLPVAIMILLVALDFGRVFMGWVSLNNMARIGANQAALNPQAWEGSGDGALQAIYFQRMAADAAAIDCVLPSPLPPPVFPDPSPNTYALGSRAQVNLACQFALVTPLISNFFGGTVPLGASAVFPIRRGTVGNLPVGVVLPSPTPSSSPTPTPTPDADADADADANARPPIAGWNLDAGVTPTADPDAGPDPCLVLLPAHVPELPGWRTAGFGRRVPHCRRHDADDCLHQHLDMDHLPRHVSGTSGTARPPTTAVASATTTRPRAGRSTRFPSR